MQFQNFVWFLLHWEWVGCFQKSYQPGETYLTEVWTSHLNNGCG